MLLGIFQGSARLKFQLQKGKTMQTSVAITRPALEKSTVVISWYRVCVFWPSYKGFNYLCCQVGFQQYGGARGAALSGGPEAWGPWEHGHQYVGAWSAAPHHAPRQTGLHSGPDDGRHSGSLWGLGKALFTFCCFFIFLHCILLHWTTYIALHFVLLYFNYCILFSPYFILLHLITFYFYCIDFCFIALHYILFIAFYLHLTHARQQLDSSGQCKEVMWQQCCILLFELLFIASFV